MVQQVLDSLCDTIAECGTAAYADLSTKMVLVTNTTTDMSRDGLNALCAEGSTVLGDGQTGLIASPDRVNVFLRSETEPTDALMCSCTLGFDYQALLKEMNIALAALAEEGQA